MHVLFVAPHFPANQWQFARALKQTGAFVTGIGEAPAHMLPGALRDSIDNWEQVGNVCSPKLLEQAVRKVQSQGWVDRLEATIEAHMMAAAQVRERTGIPGLTAKQVQLCRDKPMMKEVLRQAGVPCAASAGVSTTDEALKFAAEVGYPLILKMRDGAGSAGTYKVTDDNELKAAARELHLDRGGSAAIEEFIEGHEGFHDTLICGNDIVYEGISHYFPNVLHAMRTRDVSPMIVTTNQVHTNPHYDQVKALGRKVINAFGLRNTATHMEWFYGPKGLKFSEIGARPPGVCFWDVHNAANDFDLYRGWAEMLVHGKVSQRPSRRYSAALMSLRPTRDGRIAGYSGVEAAQRKYGQWIVKANLPPEGSRTQGVEGGYMANAWIQVRHPDFDTLKHMCNDIGDMITVHAR